MSNSVNLIHEVIDQKVENNEMFTAFDISKQVQTLQKERNLPFERHSLMKDDIHQVMKHWLSEHYEKTTIDVGEHIRPILYYPQNADPTTYVNQNHIDVVQVNVPVQQPQLAVTNYHPDARGTLCVPAELVRGVLFNVGETVYTMAGNDGHGRAIVEIVRQIPAGQESLAAYTVDDYSNIRVTRPTLIKAGLATNDIANDLYEFFIQNGTIVIRMI